MTGILKNLCIYKSMTGILLDLHIFIKLWQVFCKICIFINCMRFVFSFSTSSFNNLGNPSSTLALFPLSLSLCTFCLREENSRAMLQVVLPFTSVFVSVREKHCALAVFFAAFKVSFVPTAIFKLKLADTFENVLRELTLVSLLWLRKVVNSFA